MRPFALTPDVSLPHSSPRLLLCIGLPFCGRDVRETTEVQARGLLPARHEGRMR